MANKLLELVNALGRDAALATEYEADPDAVLARYGLSDEEKSAMKSCDCAVVGRLCGIGENYYATNGVIKAYDSKDGEY
ncbi:MAG: hypothetical protein CVU24_15140 [Betaproteobacteria bacterium HGW-Betaproteobacteria-18]|jgi:hypothetical protein|nr:MAG: hypothetical protein CVU24_15140 [Betaproteobacteria bacterium HGW-Betaproteobacteria-18]